jgi:hypothetical protein
LDSLWRQSSLRLPRVRRVLWLRQLNQSLEAMKEMALLNFTS